MKDVDDTVNFGGNEAFNKAFLNYQRYRQLSAKTPIVRDSVLAFSGRDLAHAQRLAIDQDLVALADLGTDPGAGAVDGDPPLADQAVGLAARAESGVADVFVQAHAGRRRGAPLFQGGGA